MAERRMTALGMLTLLAAMGAPLGAQAAPTIQLAFGYECGDRFIVRNDGTQPVLVEYAAVGMQDRSELHLAGKQRAEIASAQAGDLQLWVDGRVVASEPKGNRPCAVPDSGATPSRDTASARPPGAAPRAAPPRDSTAGADSTHTAPPVFVWQPPTDIRYPIPIGGFRPPFFYPPMAPRGAGASGGPEMSRGGGGGGARARRMERLSRQVAK